jgi:hypothetical protein
VKTNPLKPKTKPLKVTLRGSAKDILIPNFLRAKESTPLPLTSQSSGFQKDVSMLHYNRDKAIQHLESMPSGHWATLPLTGLREDQLNRLLLAASWSGVGIAIEGDQYVFTSRYDALKGVDHE